MLAHLSRRLCVRLAPTCRTSLSLSVTALPSAAFAHTVSYSTVPTTITSSTTLSVGNSNSGNTLSGVVRLGAGGVGSILFSEDDGTGGYVGGKGWIERRRGMMMAISTT